MFEGALQLIGMAVLAFFALIAMLVLFVLVFGKRVQKLWEYEAHFSDETGKYLGEFEIEMSKVGKAVEHTLKADFEAHHESLALGQSVEIYLEDRMVLQGTVENPGRVTLIEDDVQVQELEPSVGQTCRVVIDNHDRWQAELKLD